MISMKSKYLTNEQLVEFKFKGQGKNVSICSVASILSPGNIRIGDHERIDDFVHVIAQLPICLVRSGKP